eukprot:6685248-Prymnesium_polylepis.2
MDRHLLLRSLAPLVIILTVPAIGGAVSSVQYWRSSTESERRSDEAFDGNDQSASLSGAAKRGLTNWLPFSLVLTFCFSPS